MSVYDTIELVMTGQHSTRLRQTAQYIFSEPWKIVFCHTQILLCQVNSNLKFIGQPIEVSQYTNMKYSRNSTTIKLGMQFSNKYGIIFY